MCTKNTIVRCAWVSDDPIYLEYHDTKWGRPNYDSQDLFAKLCLDGQQAGLSWLTILKKQKNFEAAFLNFDPYRVSEFSESDVERLMQDRGIIRNRLKIQSVIKNARAYIALEEQGIAFNEYIWSFVNDKTIQTECRKSEDVPVTTNQSDMMAKSLKKAGFSFVGSTICYAFMQAVGLVNDHLTSCSVYDEVRELGRY